jgi:hypothetical protein
MTLRTLPLIGLLLALAVVAASCSGGEQTSQVASLETNEASVSESDATGQADPLVETEEAMLAFTQCLRDQGIDVDDPTVDANGNLQLPPINLEFEADEADPEEAMAGMEALMAPCEEHLEGITQTTSSGDDSKFEDALLEYAECMRENGVDMPDPSFSSGSGMIELGASSEQEFEAADAACKHLIADLGISG